MSLLEVLIAMAILLMALVGIGRLISLSTDRAALVQEQGMAALRCQSKLAEVVAGVEPLQGQSEVPFEDDPNWSWSLVAEPRDEAANLWSVQVRVMRVNADGNRIESVLNQLVVDPRYRGGTTAVAPTGSDAATGQGGTQTGGGTTGGGGTGGGTTPGGGGGQPIGGKGGGGIPGIPGGKGGNFTGKGGKQ